MTLHGSRCEDARRRVGEHVGAVTRVYIVARAYSRSSSLIRQSPPPSLTWRCWRSFIPVVGADCVVLTSRPRPSRILGVTGANKPTTASTCRTTARGGVVAVPSRWSWTRAVRESVTPTTGSPASSPLDAQLPACRASAHACHGRTRSVSEAARSAMMCLWSRGIAAGDRPRGQSSDVSLRCWRAATGTPRARLPGQRLAPQPRAARTRAPAPRPARARPMLPRARA